MKVYIEYKLFILLSFLCIYFSSSASPYIVRSLQNPKCRTNNCSEVAFTHLVKDESTGNLYIGATNSLYKVSPNLTIDVSNETGPKEDNPECFYPQDRSCTNKRLEPSYVKVLVIDPKNSTLIHCTSLFQGSCEKRMLSNLTVTFTTSKPIVANNRTATTVAFIAPGPSESLPRPDAFYVGVSWTRTGLGAARALVPAVSSRRLTDFEFVYKGISVNSFKKIDDLNKETFPVRYIYGFSSEGFSYMATVQKKDAKSDNYISKLIRVCQNDSKFYSYAELELRCSHNGAVYNLLKVAHIGKPSQKLAEVINIPRSEEVLFAMFMIGSNPQFDPQRQESVMCIYKMRDIRRIFTKNIKSCFEGIGNTGPDYLAQPTNCKQSALKENIDDDYCGLYDINTPIDGPDLVEANGAMTLNSTATSLVVTITNKYTVAFVGTDKGHIHKVAIESDRQAYPYEDVTIEQGRAIQKDKYFDADQSNLYVLTDNKLHKMIVQNCSQYTSCATCRGAKDPYCGWCSLENKCSLARDCNNYSEDLRWLGYSGKSCSKVQQVYPDKIQKDNKLSKTTTLTLNISNLPSYTGVYKCSFDGLMTPATRKPGTNVITCDTPSPNEIKPFPTGSDHIVMKLSVIMMDREFVSTNFTIFDCEIHSQDSCHKCTASRFNCTWCIKNHRCSRYPLDDCLENDEFVAGQNSNGLSIPYRNGPEFCPRIGGSVTYIRVPSGSTEKITISGIHLRDYQMPVKCFFSIGSGKTVGARVIPYDTQNKLIECESVDFSYIQDSKIWNVPLKILWGSTHPKPLDNPKGMQVQMYKCEKMADSCGECLTQKPLYNCGWCSDEDACSIQRNCHNTANWLPSQSNCPNPQINKIYPLMGPREGGTLLTIEGRNLGKTYQDIVSNVDIDGIQCSPIRDDYVPSTKIVCITGAWTVDKGKKSGYVNVVVAEAFAARSPQTFTYVDPVIKSIDPKKGPKSGGTKVTLYGDYLDAGTEREVFFGSKDDDQYKCIIQSVNSMSLVCITPRVSKAGSPGKLLMQIDKQIVMTDMEFTYIKDPVISKVLRKTAILSGGIMVDVEGEGFDNIKYPKMILYHQAKTYEGDCTVQSPSRLRCRSPMLDSSMMSSVKYEEGLSLNFGFILDNVMATQNLSRNATFGNFTIFQDPVFLKFENELKSYQKKNEYLTINGKNLNRIQAEDVSIRIGKEFCNGTFIMTEKLTCTPPKYQPPSRKGGKYPEVEVIIGSNFSQYIGQLKYDESEFPLPYEYIILIAVGGGVLVIAVIIVIIMYTMKAKKNDSMMKRMQIQMDNLELKVAKECKEAFAELQTDMTELTSDLYGQVAIPFWDYRTYCMRVLFPQETDIDHPVIKDLEVDYARRDSVEKGLKLFSQLINNKTFLLIFVRTLESHKHFTMRDRVNVASLISVALQTKMEYATDILKTLLAELIEKAVDGKNHPKLLLRRTESVAEKMLTNWFTFLLYKFLRECAGEPLFMLYSAMKSQVSKGPVDASTSEARYSLSEDKLIRQQIEYKLMTIYVQDMDQFTQSPHPVRVLDCDTISQVKEKILDAIYKNAPFSSRPIKDDVDLVLIDQSPPTAEWSSGYKGRLILQDDDSTTRVEGEYKRLNTLCHYKVPDGAYMTLVPKQPPSYNNLSLSSTEKSRFYENVPFYTRSPSLNRTVTPQGVHLELDNFGVKYYHLVKQHDNEANNQGDRGSKMVSEIYLTRLLATKGTLQQFVDDLFERIFSTAHRGTALPLAIKYMFDFLDDQALLHAIEPDIVHIWKSNSLPLRFWVNVIKNPNFVFDIYKSNIVDSCLSVAAQTFMDSCSMNEHRLGKDSPSSKLLYAKDIPKYKKWVERYYQDVKMMPAISDQDMTAMLTDESRQHLDEFNTTAALYELYKYVQKYSEDLFAALEEDEFAKKNRLTYKLEQVRMAMDAEVYC